MYIGTPSDRASLGLALTIVLESHEVASSVSLKRQLAGGYLMYVIRSIDRLHRGASVISPASL